MRYTYTIYENGKNNIQIYGVEFKDFAMRRKLKDGGWQWHGKNQYWYNYLAEATLDFAEMECGESIISCAKRQFGNEYIEILRKILHQTKGVYYNTPEGKTALDEEKAISLLLETDTNVLKYGNSKEILDNVFLGEEQFLQYIQQIKEERARKEQKCQEARARKEQQRELMRQQCEERRLPTEVITSIINKEIYDIDLIDTRLQELMYWQKKGRRLSLMLLSYSEELYRNYVR